MEKGSVAAGARKEGLGFGAFYLTNWLPFLIVSYSFTF